MDVRWGLATSQGEVKRSFSLGWQSARDRASIKILVGGNLLRNYGKNNVKN